MSFTQPEPGASFQVLAPLPVAGGPRAGFARRLVAAFIDGIIVGSVTSILFVGLKAAGYALGVFLSVAYFTYLEGGRTGQTLGKRALAVRVVDLATGGPIGYARALIRYIGRIVSALAFYIGYLWMLWDPEKQTWHDKFAGSVVVPEASYPPPPPPTGLAGLPG